MDDRRPDRQADGRPPERKPIDADAVTGWGAPLIEDTDDPDLERHWWTVALRGVIAIAFGIAAFVLPITALAALVLVFGAYALIDGLLSIIAGVRRKEGRSLLMILGGMAGLFIGIVTPFMPGMTAFVLVVVAGWWALITGVFSLLTAWNAKSGIPGRRILALEGALSIVLGGLLLFFPSFGAVVLVYMIGAYALISGVSLLAVALQLRSRKDEAEAEQTVGPPARSSRERRSRASRAPG